MAQKRFFPCDHKKSFCRNVDINRVIKKKRWITRKRSLGQNVDIKRVRASDHKK